MRCTLFFGFILLSIFQFEESFGQSNPDPKGAPVNIVVKLLMPDAKFQQYDTSVKAKRIFSNLSEVKASTPEELMQSIYSADNQKWVSFNYYKPEQAEKFNKKAYKERYHENKDTSFFELVHRLEFSYNTIPTAFVKYWFVKEGKRISLHSYTLQKYNDRWYIHSVPELEDQRRLMERIQTDMFVALYRAKGKKDDLLDQLIAQTRGVFNVLDISQLTEIFKKWEKENNTAMLKHFCDGY